MSNRVNDAELTLRKMTIIITTRCNMKCRLCCEYIPRNKPFPDMTINEYGMILDRFFDIVDRVGILHLSGGEPLLHDLLPDMIDLAFEYSDKFEQFMIFTNSIVPISGKLMDTLNRHKEKLIVHASDYGITPSITNEVHHKLRESGIPHRIIKYFGDEQDFGGWVDFGPFVNYNRTPGELENIFNNCAITRDMRGNWRARDGKTHWCSRSQRGMELGLLPDVSLDYVDLFDNSSREEKREKFRNIANTRYLSACNYCSGDQGTDNIKKRYPAASQL